MAISKKVSNETLARDRSVEDDHRQFTAAATMGPDEDSDSGESAASAASTGHYTFVNSTAARVPAKDMIDCIYAPDTRVAVANAIGLDSSSSESVGMTCFSYLCRLAGVAVSSTATSVSHLSEHAAQQLAEKSEFRVYLVAFSRKDLRNHVELVTANTTNFQSKISPVDGNRDAVHTVSVTSMRHFFQKNSEWYTYRFYADNLEHSEVTDVDTSTAQPSAPPATSAFSPPAGFGAAMTSAYARQHQHSSSVPTIPAPPESVVDESVQPGGSNVSQGVVRSRRRKISAKAVPTYLNPVTRNYNVVGAMLFNNMEEMFLDQISRAYAQEIIEEVFELWGLPTDQPATMKYAEDLLLAFMIATTASNKANYDRGFVIPVEATSHSGSKEIEVNFKVLSDTLAMGHNVTRRQFSRAIADDQRTYLKHPDNTFLLARVSTRAACDPQYGTLAFDGSTHCTGMTTREETFTKTLEGRNLFERDDVVAEGASERLMQGFSGGTRSVVPR